MWSVDECSVEESRSSFSFNPSSTSGVCNNVTCSKQNAAIKFEDVGDRTYIPSQGYSGNLFISQMRCSSNLDFDRITILHRV